MTISKAETGFNERDLLIGISLGAGLNQQETADEVGVDRRTIYNRMATNAVFINAVKAHVERFVSAKIAINNEQNKRRWEDMYNKAVRNVNVMLDSEDPDTKIFATKETLDRVEGKPTQRIVNKHEGEIKHTHTRTLPADIVGIIQAVVASAPRAALPEATEAPAYEIIDAELVHPDGGSGSS
jgi:hypothetical protein